MQKRARRRISRRDSGAITEQGLAGSTDHLPSVWPARYRGLGRGAGRVGAHGGFLPPFPSEIGSETIIAEGEVTWSEGRGGQ